MTETGSSNAGGSLQERTQAVALVEFKKLIGFEWNELWAYWASSAHPDHVQETSARLREEALILKELAAAMRRAAAYVDRFSHVTPGGERLHAMGLIGRYLVRWVPDYIAPFLHVVDGKDTRGLDWEYIVGKILKQRHEGGGRSALVAAFDNETARDRIGLSRLLTPRELALVSILSGNMPTMSVPAANEQEVLRAEEKAMRLAVTRHRPKRR